MSETLRFLLVLEVLGLAGSPLAARALGRLPGAGAGLGAVLALLLVGWLFWVAGSVGLGTGDAVLAAAVGLVGVAAVVAHRRRPRGEGDRFAVRTRVVAELLFVAAFLAAALVAAHAPLVWGTEKPMDMAIVNAINASGAFPPHDPWLSGATLNYYYLGQLLLALLVRVAGVEPSAGYNLALAALFALTVKATFGVTAALAETARRQGLPLRRPWAAGLAGVGLLALAGNLRGGWDALTGGPLAAFDWFGATRVVPDTINEFPAASFAVGDLHAHVIAVPLTLLALAFAAQVVAAPARARGGPWTTACAALAIGILYAVNSWSWPVAAALLLGATLIAATDAAAPRRLLPWGVGTLALGGLLVLPFILGFEPNASGFGAVPTGAREPLGAFVRQHAAMEGALLWIVLVPLGAELARRRRVAAAAVVAVIVVGALALSGPRLGGALLAAALAAGALAVALGAGRRPAERLTWLLVSAALALLAGPELLYVRDEFADTAFVRMNTVFKLGYQAWLLLAVAGAVVLAAGPRWLPGRLSRAAWRVGAAALVAVALLYPLGAVAARTQWLAGAPSLEGRLPPVVAASDRQAIDWLRAHVAPGAVVAEAVGDDYSPDGAARISVFTGRPTVLGWQGHELQWKHDVGTRREDVETLYRSADAAQVRAIARRYGIDYAVVGPLETATYGPVGALTTIGRPVFSAGATTVYRLT